MDKLAERLRDDAARIRADVSPALDERIRASLESVASSKAAPARPARRFSLWWASSLTGIAAALGVIALLNMGGSPHAPPAESQVVAGPAVLPALAPRLRAETAVLTAPLEQELSDLESDIQKARAAVENDLGLEF